MTTNSPTEEVETIITELAISASSLNSGLLCLISDQSPLSIMEPMPRTPAPESEFAIREDFCARVEAAFALNPSIHDGAMVCRLASSGEAYELIYWSCRLFPPRFGVHEYVNRGSAFNSAIATSKVEGVDAVYFWSSAELWKFENGIASRIELKSEIG